MNTRKEFGDYQTPNDLAVQVVDVVAGLFGVPDCVVEPTAGRGAFLIACHGKWGRACRYEGYEINNACVHSANRRLSDLGIRLSQQDFFSADWHRMLRKEKLHRILVLGNPPWVTNSEQGMLGGNNLPKKANFQRLRGFDAKTGKSNFPHNDRPVMVDDTCYSIPCKCEREAWLLCDLLNATPARRFLWSLVFLDSKRPITVDVLRRLSFINVAKMMNRIDELRAFTSSGSAPPDGHQQLNLAIEQERHDQTRRRSQSK